MTSSNFSKIEYEASQVAAALGLSQSSLKVVVPQWLEVMRQGVVVKLHIRRWRAVMRLTPDHLGLYFEDQAESDAFAKSMRLGEIYLLPDRIIKTLASIDSGARKAISKYSLTTHWGEFLTPESYFDWKAEQDQFTARYYQVRADLRENWTSILAEVADMHTANARAAYRREKSRPGSQIARQFTESEFVTRYISAILDAIPSLADVLESFAIDVELTYIPLPSMIAEDQAAAEQAYQTARVSREKADLEIAMHREVTKSYRDNLNRLVVDHMRTMVSQLNGALYEAAADVLATTQANQKMHPRSVVQLRAAIGRIKSLNVLDYPDIESMVSQAESLLGVQAEGRDLAAVQAKLADIVTVTKATVLAMGDRPQRAGRDLESAAPSLDEIRGARQRLGLGQPAAEPIAATRQSRQI